MRLIALLFLLCCGGAAAQGLYSACESATGCCDVALGGSCSVGRRVFLLETDAWCEGPAVAFVDTTSGSSIYACLVARADGCLTQQVAVGQVVFVNGAVVAAPIVGSGEFELTGPGDTFYCNTTNLTCSYKGLIRLLVAPGGSGCASTAAITWNAQTTVCLALAADGTYRQKFAVNRDVSHSFIICPATLAPDHTLEFPAHDNGRVWIGKAQA